MEGEPRTATSKGWRRVLIVCVHWLANRQCQSYFGDSLLFSLPRCRVKTTNKRSKFKILKFFSLFFSHQHVKGFVLNWTISISKVDLLQEEKIYYLEACGCTFLPGNFTVGAVNGLIASDRGLNDCSLTNKWEVFAVCGGLWRCPTGPRL